MIVAPLARVSAPNHCCFRKLILWSWRRDLNPRPSDYKSDALPTELRQQVEASPYRHNTSLDPFLIVRDNYLRYHKGYWAQPKGRCHSNPRPLALGNQPQCHPPQFGPTPRNWLSDH